MKYHFTGIKGSGMSALAQVIYELGNEVEGSDVTHHLFTEDLLREKNIKILPFDENNITKDKIIVIGNAFDETNKEVKKAIEIDAKRYSYYELLHDLVNEFESVAISGILTAAPQILYLGIMSSGVAYTLQIIGQKFAEPAIASISMSLESVFAALGGWLILGYILSKSEVLGCVLVFIAITVAQLPSFKEEKTT